MALKIHRKKSSEEWFQSPFVISEGRQGEGRGLSWAGTPTLTAANGTHPSCLPTLQITMQKERKKEQCGYPTEEPTRDRSNAKWPLLSEFWWQENGSDTGVLAGLTGECTWPGKLYNVAISWAILIMKNNRTRSRMQSTARIKSRAWNMPVIPALGGWRWEDG